MPVVVTQNWTGSYLRKIPGNWEAGESWTVTGTDSKVDAIEAVEADYAEHPDNPRFKMQIPQADAIGLNTWRVSTAYRFRRVVGADDPLDEPTVYRGDFETISIPIDRDVEGNPIVNSAGDPFDPPIQGTINVFILTCERNVPSFSVGMGYTYTDAVNSNVFTLPGAGSVDVGNCLCRVYRPVSPWSFGDDFIRVQGVFAFLPGSFPWDLHIKDQGRNTWHNTGSNKPGPITDPQTGEQVLIDVALDGTGKPIKTEWKVTSQLKTAVANPSLPAGLYVDPTRSTATSKILEWYIKQEANFANLPF